LVAPVFIGAGCEVAAGATVGPDVTVGTNCVIDRGAVVTDAVVLPGTYIGEGVRLESVVVDQDRVIVSRGDESVVVASGVAVRSLTDHVPGRLRAVFTRWRTRSAHLVTSLRGVEKVFRRSVSEVLGSSDRTGTQPEAVPIATTTD